MQAHFNQRITQTGPGTPAGQLLRQYWHPVALLDEFDPKFDPEMAQRPLKAVRALGQDFVLFKDDQGRFSLLDRACPHRGADLKFARHEGDGIRCPFHGWKFDATGQCLETPAEPWVDGKPSTLCQRIRQPSYPLREVGGALFAYLGPAPAAGQSLPELPAFDCFTAPASHRFAFKGLWHCNWLQAFEVGIDPAHPSFLHRMLDEGVDDQAQMGRQFRSASVGSLDGEHWPMTRVMRECPNPDIHHEPLLGPAHAGAPGAASGLTRITALRRINAGHTHVRVTNALFPYTFVIPLSQTITITQMHVPVDDERTYWWSFFTSFDGPLDQDLMRRQRLANNPGPQFLPRMGRHNDWGYNPQEQRKRTFLGMGEADINVHDQWACESMGAIADRTREHLGLSDKVIIHNRRMLLGAIDAVQQGRKPPAVFAANEASALTGPHTIDCIAPADGWQSRWHEWALAKRQQAPWLSQAATPPPEPAAQVPSPSTPNTEPPA